MLERDYLVEDFENAEDLLEFLQRKPCDLILSDLFLPNMDGFEFIRGLKKNARLSNIPVVALTASSSDETRRRAMAEGFDAYLVKPYGLDLLLFVVAQCLRNVA
jgi:CheY-like chemotaxis protein